MANGECVILIIWTVAITVRIDFKWDCYSKLWVYEVHSTNDLLNYVRLFNGNILTRWTCRWIIDMNVTVSTMWEKKFSIIWTTNWFAFWSIPSMKNWALGQWSNMVAATSIIQIPGTAIPLMSNGAYLKISIIQHINHFIIPMDIIKLVAFFTFAMGWTANTSFWALCTINIQTNLKISFLFVAFFSF